MFWTQNIKMVFGLTNIGHVLLKIYCSYLYDIAKGSPAIKWIKIHFWTKGADLCQVIWSVPLALNFSCQWPPKIPGRQVVHPWATAFSFNYSYSRALFRRFLFRMSLIQNSMILIRYITFQTHIGLFLSPLNLIFNEASPLKLHCYMR